jgi:Tol biopolymer transport system component
MVLIGSGHSPQLLYDVSDPVNPRLLCTISNTSAHLFTGDTFEYLKPVSPDETDVILHSLGSGNESVVAKFPLYVAFASWLPDLSLVAYATQVSGDNYPSGGTQVWLYSQRRTAPLFTYRNGFGDCICRFGLQEAVLAVSPDGQYVVAGRLDGKGSEPLAVYRISARARVATMAPDVVSAFWSVKGHRLFLVRAGAGPAQSWTPEVGLTRLAGAGAWSYLPGMSPDGNRVAYTAYANPSAPQTLRAYVYDVKAGSTRLVVDKLRSQALFIKDGWVWYLEEAPCDPVKCGLPWGTKPSGKVFAMNLSTGVELVVKFRAATEDPFNQPIGLYQVNFTPGEFWPAA